MDQRNYMHPHHHTHISNMHQLCHQHMNRRVRAQLADGQVYEGIVEHVDEQNVYLIIEINVLTREDEEEIEVEDDRNFGYGYGYGYPPYGYGYPGYYPGYGYPGFGYPGYGYGRLILPLAALTALSLI